REIAEMLVRITGSDAGIQYMPEGVTFVRNRIGSPDRAREEIGFEARVALEDGLRALIDWRQSHQAEVRERQERMLTP
ncbi:MAG TPA: hypothetical protein VG106_09360, partial [Vicinamibacterales bacterium]|nr:hypothetical protein [Vicinamibacterales bacterium]